MSEILWWKSLNSPRFSLKRDTDTKRAEQFCKTSIFVWQNWCRDLGPKKYTLRCKLIFCVLIWCKFYINFVEKKVDDRGGCYYLDRFPVSSVSKNGAQIFLKLQLNLWTNNNCIMWRFLLVDVILLICVYSYFLGKFLSLIYLILWESLEKKIQAYVEKYSIEDNSKNIILILSCVEKFERDESVSSTYLLLLECEFYCTFREKKLLRTFKFQNCNFKNVLAPFYLV